jgi:glycosyltransferase involved in cell wall biosynthesis
MPSPRPLPPIAREPISVVLLAHNQAATVEEVVTSWIQFLNSLERDFEVILVDDGSTDETSERAASLATRSPRLQVLSHPTAQGQGAALRTALKTARHPLFFYTICDPQYRPSDLGRLLQKRTDPRRDDLELDQVHLMTGSRAGEPIPLPWRIVGLFWRLFWGIVLSHPLAKQPGWLGWKRELGRCLVRLLFGVRYHDVACPFRLQRRAIFSRIPLQSNGPFVHVEILAKANFLGLIMAEELPLAAGHYPPFGERESKADFQQIVADARRVIRHPEFGSPEVPMPEENRIAAGQNGGCNDLSEPEA